MSVATFAYAQARLQARHAQRPGASDWRVLEGVGDAVHFLQVARRTRLRHWVLGLQGQQDSHSIERLLRRQFQEYVDEVLRWLPPPWNGAADWLKRLPELPAIQHLLSGAEPPDWMHADARLGEFARGDYEHRLQALQRSDCAPLVAAWQRGESLANAWFARWRLVWLGGLPADDGLVRLTGLLERALEPAAAGDARRLEDLREALFARLTALFRRCAFAPAAAFAHLALTALDLVTLRGELMQRVVFPAARVAP